MKSILKYLFSYSFHGSNHRYIGSGTLMIAVLSAVIAGFTVLGATQVNQAVFSGFNNNKLALQAQEYALSKAQLVRAVNYDDITAQSKSQISNSVDFYDEVIVSTESNYPNGNNIKQKICTINVYKGDDSSPCYSTRVTRLSADSNSSTDSIPAGSVIAWSGTTSNIPSGFALCNGSNGTPDLRNKFLVGAGSTYSKGATGGADTVTLTIAQVGNHYHAWGYHNGNNTGRFLGTGGTTKNYPLASGTNGAYWNGSGGGGNSGESTSSLNLITSLATSSATPSAHENRPPYYALFYIMKLNS